jgi:hypothetical protein
MFRGNKINATEKRAVLHTALRRAALCLNDCRPENLVPTVHAVLDRMTSHDADELSEDPQVSGKLIHRFRLMRRGHRCAKRSKRPQTVSAACASRGAEQPLLITAFLAVSLFVTLYVFAKTFSQRPCRLPGSPVSFNLFERLPLGFRRQPVEKDPGRDTGCTV